MFWNNIITKSEIFKNPVWMSKFLPEKSHPAKQRQKQLITHSIIQNKHKKSTNFDTNQLELFLKVLNVI